MYPKTAIRSSENAAALFSTWPFPTAIPGLIYMAALYPPHLDPHLSIPKSDPQPAKANTNRSNDTRLRPSRQAVLARVHER